MGRRKILWPKTIYVDEDGVVTYKKGINDIKVKEEYISNIEGKYEVRQRYVYTKKSPFIQQELKLEF